MSPILAQLLFLMALLLFRWTMGKALGAGKCGVPQVWEPTGLDPICPCCTSFPRGFLACRKG